MKVDWLIVGAGLSGCVLAERIATQLGRRVVVVERSPHVAGNVYDETDEHGVLVHRYGPHIFHTGLPHVWEYLSRFTRWIPYFHRVRTMVDGRCVPVPFNFESLHMLFGPKDAARIERLLTLRYAPNQRVPIMDLRNSPDPELRHMAEFVFDSIFRGYTIKQWGIKPEKLASSVMARVPVCIGHEDRYFHAPYQGIPSEGYTVMLRRMLDHPNITVLLNTDFCEVRHRIQFNRMIYTGAIDEFFGYVHGDLPYRSMRFEFSHLSQERFQSVAVVTYPNSEAFTRITEFKHFTGQSHSGTTIAREYPEVHRRGYNVAHYPVPCKESAKLFARYRRDALGLRNLLFAGRLADYRYYNMDQAVARSLAVFRERVLVTSSPSAVTSGREAG